jgi:hypothetical protein
MILITLSILHYVRINITLRHILDANKFFKDKVYIMYEIQNVLFFVIISHANI